MKTIKGNKNELIKEYKNFCKDFNFIEYFTASKEYFAKIFIENEIKMNGIFYNDFFKIKDLEEIKKEIYLVLNENIKNKNIKLN